jgi:hypothetical protein
MTLRPAVLPPPGLVPVAARQIALKQDGMPELTGRAHQAPLRGTFTLQCSRRRGAAVFMTPWAALLAYCSVVVTLGLRAAAAAAAAAAITD